MKRTALIVLVTILTPTFNRSAVCETTDSTPTTFYVDVNAVNEPGTGTSDDPFKCIQTALDAAADTDTVIIRPGLYTGTGNYDLDPNGLAVTIQSTDPNDPDVIADTIINPNNAGRGFIFQHGEDANTVINGLTITGAYHTHGGAIYCQYTNPTIRNCRIINNQAEFFGGGILGEVEEKNGKYSCPQILNSFFSGNTTGYDGAAVCFCDGLVTNCIFVNNTAVRHGGALNGCYGPIANCTFVANAAQTSGGAIYDCKGPVSNCIFAHNRQHAIYEFYPANDPAVTYCLFYQNPDGDYYDDDTTSTLTGADQINCLPQAVGNLDAEPYFAAFDPAGNPGNWDFHLQSAYGRWDPAAGTWVTDANTSAAIDAGDPNSDYTAEPWPNGRHINLGAYGATPQASLFGNPADFNIDGITDHSDYASLARWWSTTGKCYEDLDTDGTVDIADLAIFRLHWLWQKP